MYQTIVKIKDIFLKKDILVYILLALFIFLHIYIVQRTFLIDSDGTMKVLIAGYGDIPFHMTQVSKFGFGDLFDLNEPIFTGENIRYAFLINYLSGIFLRMTDSWSFALHFPVMVLLVAAYIFIFLTFRHVLGKGWAALLAVILFMLGSGLGGWDLIKEHLWPNIMHPSVFTDYLMDNNISTVSYWKAVYPEQNISWGGAMSLVFLHQRAFFMGLFLFSVVIYTLARFPNLDNKKWRWLAGIAFGLGPLGHYHTFLTLSLILGAYSLVALIRKNFQLFKNIIFVCAVAFVIALPQIIYLSGGNNPLESDSQSFINFRLGWMVEPTIGSVKYPEGEEIGGFDKFVTYLNFLWTNFGFILPLLGLSFFYRPLRRGSGFPVLWFAVILFIFVQTVRTQPWDYDTNKILVYFNFFASAAIISLLVWLADRQRILGRIMISLAVILIIFSGVIDILPRIMMPVERIPVIFNRDAIKTAYFIRQNVEPRDIVMTSSTHLNIVSSLAGRPSIVGYPGWLWTKGVPYGERESELRDFYLDPVSYRHIAKKYRAHYILIDPALIYDWKVNKETFDKNFKLLYSSGGYFIYLFE